MNILLLPILISLIASPSAFTIPVSEPVVLENGGDGFVLSDTSYEGTQSFVYTATAKFEHGQACGLVFGGEQDEHYWVFNVDRQANRTKLMYFYDHDGFKPDVLEEAPFIGNDKTTGSEYNVINPSLSGLQEFHFKLVITIESEKAYAEFFLENIKRFGVDRTIDLNEYSDDFKYEGGYLGFNVFNGKVAFDNTTIGQSDYSYYTEPYRNQYHYSQYAHWNNDPNGLVYYQGWYHMYYQTHPFSKQWSDMYWGHARSRDLVHWQELPIALFPDDGNMGVGTGKGLAWSGIAMVYHQGMSTTIDNEHWFSGESGLLGFYTRDGDKQDQVIITSDDGGMTWIKRRHIPQTLGEIPENKVDCRDPSIFQFSKGGVTTWGMVLSGGTQNKIWFLQSNDLVNWEYAGKMDYVYPECATVAKVKASDGTSHYMMSISSRYYTVGDFVYDSNPYNTDINKLFFVPINDGFKKMDYAEDSYAAQCFYIDDSTSAYYGQNIMISWYQGLPSDAESGIYASVRDPWNGSGMTIPVSLGLKKSGGNYLLTQEPITVENTDLTKESIVNVENTEYAGENNPLSPVSGHTYELKSSISNPNQEDVTFEVNIGDDEVTRFGWNKTDGYFFDRRETGDAGIHFGKTYHSKYVNGQTDITELSFYALVDEGGIELFVDDYTYAFYNLTLSSHFANKADLKVSGKVTINSLEVSNIASTWKETSTEGNIILSHKNVDLDLNLCQEQKIVAYSLGGVALAWQIESGADVISLTPSEKGAVVSATKNGEAIIKVSAGTISKFIPVTVDNGSFDAPFALNKDNVYSGTWRTTSEGLVGYQAGGDGFVISNMQKANVTYSAVFDLTKADAAGLLLRASNDMSSYIMTNYDKNGKVCKIWSNNGELAVVGADIGDVSNIYFSVILKDRSINVSVNGVQASATLRPNDPATGYLGFNVCSGTVTFKKATILKEDYDFTNADVVVESNVEQYVNAIYNITKHGEVVNKDFYSVSGKKITLKKEYFQTLSEHTTYTFFVEGTKSSFEVKISVDTIEKETVTLNDVTVDQGQDVTIYIGDLSITSLTINGVAVDASKYSVSNRVLHLDASLFKKGQENVVTINNAYSFKVNIKDKTPANPTPETPTEPETEPQSASFPVVWIVVIAVGSALVLAGATVLVIFLIRRKKGAKHV